ncbi:MAG: MarR family transcriptional regulator [Woeseiaceae bacterium]
MKQDIVDQLLDQWTIERPKSDVSALGVVVRIQMLAKSLHRQTTIALKKHGLKHWEYDVLSVLRRQGTPFEMASTEIARAAMLSSGAMTTRIDGLESRGLVRRRRSRTDRRSVSVRLTTKGKKSIDLAIETRMEDARKVLDNIQGSSRKQLADSLRCLLLDVDK